MKQVDARLLEMYTALLSAVDLRTAALTERQVEGVCRAMVKNARIALAVFDMEINKEK